MVERVQASREIMVGKSAVSMLRRDGERNSSSEAADSTLPRKAAIEIVGARTVNRHR